MTAEQILRANSGKQPAEIVNALLLAGYAIVPTEMTLAMQGRRSLSMSKDHIGRYAAVIEEGRVKL